VRAYALFCGVNARAGYTSKLRNAFSGGLVVSEEKRGTCETHKYASLFSNVRSLSLFRTRWPFVAAHRH